MVFVSKYDLDGADSSVRVCIAVYNCSRNWSRVEQMIRIVVLVVSDRIWCRKSVTRSQKYILRVGLAMSGIYSEYLCRHEDTWMFNLKVIVVLVDSERGDRRAARLHHYH